MTQNPKFKYEDWGPTFLSPVFVKTVISANWCTLGLEAFEGYTAPDTTVYTMDGQKTSIHRFLKDDWAFANNFDIRVHKNMEERLAAARVLVKEDPLCPVVVDEMSNITTSKYGALPERLYVLQNGKVIHQGGIGPWGYRPEEVRKVLEKMK
ncbi:Type I iodothyronine deiodinase [Triplophysa tibetana]|uniref:Iodothyronine deiodinase n=1 Tax=Triplophysa tibetana TaxID=1572043 RepID=A0A5A9NZJ8_9TELE|nr:Type I iodothyronine deiodinase [Triplophysa tibetana]